MPLGKPNHPMTSSTFAIIWNGSAGISSLPPRPAAGSCHRNTAEVSRSVSADYRPLTRRKVRYLRPGMTAERAIVKDQLESLVGMMVERGILLEEAVTEFEKKFIKRVLERLHGNQSRAAKALGIHRNTLSRKVGEYKLDHVSRRRS